MKTIILICLLLSGIFLQESSKEKSRCLKIATDFNNQVIFENETNTDISDSTQGAIPPQWLITIISINDDLTKIRDTSLYSKYLPGDKTSSYIPQERRGVRYARKIESYFHYISAASTISKNGRCYILTSEDMEQIHSLYKSWWNRILECENVDEMEQALSMHPLIGSPYEWKVDPYAIGTN